MKKFTCLLLAFASTASLAASCPSCYIGNRPGALTLTLGGGYLYLDSSRDMNNKGVGLVEVGYDFTPNWGIDGLLAFFRTNFDHDAVTSGRSVDGTLFSINAAYHLLPQYAFQPYILAGIGILGLSHNHDDVNNAGNINVAIGLQYFFNKIFSVRVEARDLYSPVEKRNDVLLSGGLGATFDFC